jgi:hypothetical protein
MNKTVKSFTRTGVMMLRPCYEVRLRHALWIHFAAPTSGMLVAAEVFLQARGALVPTAQSCTTPLQALHIPPRKSNNCDP